MRQCFNILKEGVILLFDGLEICLEKVVFTLDVIIVHF